MWQENLCKNLNFLATVQEYRVEDSQKKKVFLFHFNSSNLEPYNDLRHELFYVFILAASEGELHPCRPQVDPFIVFWIN